jgi:hypothetical protein
VQYLSSFYSEEYCKEYKLYRVESNFAFRLSVLFTYIMDGELMITETNSMGRVFITQVQDENLGSVKVGDIDFKITATIF